MTVKSTLIAGIVLVAVNGCAARRHYAYPIDPSGQVANDFYPEKLYEKLMACATAQNFASHTMLSRVFVDLDGHTHLTFELEKGSDSRMDVRLDEKGKDEAATEQLFTAAKAKGDVLLECAKQKLATPGI